MIIFGCGKTVDSKKQLTMDDSIANIISTNADSLSLNFRDRIGLKQGKWVSENNNKKSEIFTYINDTLNGYYSVGNADWRNEGHYKNGELDGIQRTYEGKRVKHIRNYKKGKSIWQVSYDEKYIIPLKDFIIPEDTIIYINVPFPNGRTWYEGRFINSKQFKSKSFPFFKTYKIGTHKIYFENGILRGLVQYDKKLITEYDSLGRAIYNTKFKDVNTHHQVVDMIYFE